MAGKILIDVECCKGCGLCVSACPKQCIRMSARTNSKGFTVVEYDPTKCIGCATCGLMCPDVAIEVWRDDGQGPEGQMKKRQMVRGTS